MTRAAAAEKEDDDDEMFSKKQIKHHMIVAHNADDLDKRIEEFLSKLGDDDYVTSTQLTHTILPPEISTHFRSVFTYIVVYEHHT